MGHGLNAEGQGIRREARLRRIRACQGQVTVPGPARPFPAIRRNGLAAVRY